MNRLYLRVRAPFAAFRGFEAGDYLSTAPTMTYSAAWGLLLNFAGIDTRVGGGPPLRIAIGTVTPAIVNSLYQQLHIYRVGDSGKKGPNEIPYKTNIRPYRRELLVDLDVQLAVEGDESTLNRIESGLTLGGGGSYGLPFVGDNNYLIDSVELLGDPLRVPWFERVGQTGVRSGSCRLTTKIDRVDSSLTEVVLVAPGEETLVFPPEDSWFWIPREPVPC